MVIVDTYYQLVEKDTDTVNGLLKVIHVIGYGIAAITGFLATYCFYIFWQSFAMNCILYPDMEFTSLNENDPYINQLPQNMTIDARATIWQTNFMCHYCISVWMMSFVGGTILGSFFVISPRGGQGYPHSTFSQPWKMIYPMTLVSLIMAIVCGAAAIIAIEGINAFCASFQNITGNASCTDLLDVYSLKFHEEPIKVNRNRKIVVHCSVLVFIAWTYCVVVLLIRVCLAPDFKLQIINIHPKKRPTLTDKDNIITTPSTLSFPVKIDSIKQLSVDENDSILSSPSKTDQSETDNTSKRNLMPIKLSSLQRL